jgi:hypothetical protein
MPILDTIIYVIGDAVLLVALMWCISQITATALMAYYKWKDRR